MRCSVGGLPLAGASAISPGADQRRGNLGGADISQVNLDFQYIYSRGLGRYDVVEALPCV